jgi:hypothetical protein
LTSTLRIADRTDRTRALLSEFSMRPVVFLAVATIAVSPARAVSDDVNPVRANAEFFEKNVRPILANNCYTCHSASTNARGDLRVDDRQGLIRGGNTGPAVVPGDPANSLLLKAVSYTDDNLKMPPKKRLTAAQVADLSRWIKEGAAWPAERMPPSLGKPNAKYERLRKGHWAWQPLTTGAVPAVRDSSWPRDDIDRFILSKLEEKGLKPVHDADRLTLIRRLTFDLTGLPPAPDDIQAPAGDSESSIETTVDRLLDSPAFGERWGRHWLDVARYGESTGSSRNLPYPHAWRYRDYVIDAINRDKPFDQFVREQIAGDLLPAGSQTERDEQLIATGFLALGVKDVNQRFKVRFIMDNVDEQIDTVSRAILGLTVSCARCHDHKFDPIPTAEYYALAGIFRSSDLCAALRNKMGGGGLDYYDPSLLVKLGEDAKPEPDLEKKIAAATKAFEQAKREFDAVRGTPKGLARGLDGLPFQRPFRLKMVKLQNELLSLTDPSVNGAVTLGVRDSQMVADTEIRLRGEAEKLGPIVPRGFVSVVQFPGQPKVNPRQSGRLELAQWLSSDKNPLTPRVMVNRVWAHLFGAGLVSSVDNFGVMGQRPSHPELLDHLSARLIRDGWSLKRLVRAIVLTRAYQLGSEEATANLAVDPAARLVWRHNPRRMAAEEIRDATLASSGNLDLSRPKGSPVKSLRVAEIRNNGPEAARFGTLAQAQVHRSVYLPLLRGITPASLAVFDFAEQGLVTGSRDVTTVATQALYLLNDSFVRRQSLALAERLLARTELDAAGRIDWAYRLTLSRSPSPNEVSRARTFLSEFESAAARLFATEARGRQKSVIALGLSAGDDAPATDATAGGNRKAAPVVPVNPDEIVAVEVLAKEELVRPSSPEAAAWASFCQALFGSAEFRYVR